MKKRPQGDDILYFRCPVCEPSHGIMISWEAPSIVEDGSIWKKTGDSVDNITIKPSIDCSRPSKKNNHKPCKFHGHVTDGFVTW